MMLYTFQVIYFHTFKDISEMISRMDLGISRVGINKRVMVAKVTTENTLTDKQIKKVAECIKQGFEEQGHTDITVTFLSMKEVYE